MIVNGFTKTLNHRKIFRKTQKQPSENQNNLSRGPVFTFSLPGEAVRTPVTRQLRHHKRTGKQFTGGAEKIALKITICPKNKQFVQITRITSVWIYNVLKNFHRTGFLSNLRLPWNFSLYWNIFYHSGFLKQPALALKFSIRGCCRLPRAVRHWLSWRWLWWWYRCASLCTVFVNVFSASLAFPFCLRQLTSGAGVS